jgi:hypothetical protein
MAEEEPRPKLLWASPADRWSSDCCFCSKDVNHAAPDGLTLIALPVAQVKENPPTAQLWCHAACLRSRLTEQEREAVDRLTS